jgi:CubicO group peptidase (beta-lactamase class C family)
MTGRHFTVLFLLVFLVTACGRPASTPTPEPSTDEDLFAAVRERIEGLLSEGEIPSLAVAVAREGELIWEEGFGLADRERNTPATENTVYPLGSLSQPLTATGLMVLVEQGLVDLDRPINEYLGDDKLRAWVGDVTNATVRRVATHTAGLPRHEHAFYEDESVQPMPVDRTVLLYGNLVDPPGERWQPSGLGYGMLARMIERVSGENLADFMREEVFVPLGMTRTSVDLISATEENLATPYGPDLLPFPRWEFDMPGYAGMYSSAHDLIRFAMFHLKNQRADMEAIINEGTIDEMQLPTADRGQAGDRSLGHGIGWKTVEWENGLRVVAYGGQWTQTSTQLALVPESNIGVVVLANTNSAAVEQIMSDIMRTLLPDAFVVANPDVTTPPPFEPGQDLIGLGRGFIFTPSGELPTFFEITDSGLVIVQLGENVRAALSDPTYMNDYPLTESVGGGPYLRGWLDGRLWFEDETRTKPQQVLVELKLRDDVLSGTLTAEYGTEDRRRSTAAYWVELTKLP